MARVRMVNTTRLNRRKLTASKPYVQIVVIAMTRTSKTPAIVRKRDWSSEELLCGRYSCFDKLEWHGRKAVAGREGVRG
jgi:hypothetical protein